MNEALLQLAQQAREQAYCPYSGYQVGAALISEEGGVFSGCNVENVSFGHTICAERSAVLAMAAAGHRRLKEVVVFTRDGGTPCGACLQVMTEFAPEPEAVSVHCVNESGEVKSYTLRQLMPHAFRSPAVNRTEL